VLRAQPRGQRDRALVVGSDQADQRSEAERVASEGARRARGLERVALPPGVPRHQPRQFAARPAHGVEEPDATDQPAVAAPLERPHAVPVQRPLAEEQRHLAPGDVAPHRAAAADVAHHLGVGAQRRVGVQVVEREGAQAQPLGGQARDRVHRVPAGARRPFSPAGGR
jgi:hypothetical protein